jgi:cytidylate kinase
MPLASHVAIDGPVASGKSTVAKRVAERLGYLYLDTGAMYRALAFAALDASVDPLDEGALIQLLAKRPIVVELDGGSALGYRIRLGSRELGTELFAPDVTALVSRVAAYPRVRAEMVVRQRAIAAGGPVVMAGRDIGTIVLPDAPFKVYLTASVEARVERRAAELEARGQTVDRCALRTEIEVRDASDRGRAVAPLRAAADATVVDSSSLEPHEVVERIVALVAPRSPN